MSTKTGILRKSLTNKLHVTILETVGISQEPLTSRDIEYHYAKQYSQRHLQLAGRSAYKHSDVYRVIKELSGIDTGKKMLFGSWNELSTRKDEMFKSHFVKKLNKLLSSPKMDNNNNNNSYTFKTFQDKNKTTYYLDIASPKSERPKWRFLQNNIIRINFDSKSRTGRIITDEHRLGVPMYVRYLEENRDFELYVKLRDTTKATIMNRVPFLRPVLKNNPMDDNSFKYYLTLKGFLLLLLGAESSGISNGKINKVIKALTENRFTRNDYPFLWNYHILDEVVGWNFKIEVLKKIAFESQYSLLSERDNFIRYWVTSHFHTAIAFFFGGPPLFVPTVKLSILGNRIKLTSVIKWIKEYDKKMLEYSLSYLRLEVADLTALLQLKRDGHEASV